MLLRPKSPRPPERKTLGLQVDVSSEADVARMAAETVKAFRRIDILVNKRGDLQHAGIEGVREDRRAEWRKVMDVTRSALFLCCRACTPHMRAGGYGRIINLASGAPLKGVPLFLHYIASKGAVIAMTRGLARELGKDGITVNTLPRDLLFQKMFQKMEQHTRQGEKTRLTRAIQRDETPEDLVGTVSFLASADAAFLTGQTIVVDGGSAML